MLTAGCGVVADTVEPQADSPDAGDARHEPSADANDDLLGDAADEAGETGRTLRWAIGDPGDVVPPLATGDAALHVVGALFDGLTVLDADGDPRPATAEAWQSDREARAWTFFLDPDAQFHDGTPVTADDVRASWEAGVRLGLLPPHLRDVLGYDDLAAGEAEHLRGILVSDDHTLHVLLARARPDFPTVVAHPALAPIPAETWTDDPEEYARHPVGNGPYALVEPWASGDFLRLERVAAAEEPLAPEEVVFRVTDETTGYLAFQQGRVDIAAVPLAALDEAVARFGDRVEGSGGPGIVREPSLGVYGLAIDVSSRPLDDPAVRRALSLAIDREALAEAAFEGNALPARTMASPAIPGAPASTCPSCLHAPSSAERILDGAGVRQLTLWIDEDGGHDTVVAQLREDLDAVGVTLRVRRVPFGNFVAAAETGLAALFRSGWKPDHPTLEDAITPSYHSRYADGRLATGNPGGYRNEEVDTILDEAASILDLEERAARYAAAERIALGRDLAHVPLVTLQHRLAVGERIASGAEIDPAGRIDLRDVRLVD